MVVLALSLVYCGGSKQDEPLRKNVDLASCFKTFLTAQDLENAGFEHISNMYIIAPFFVGDNYYLQNSGDKKIVKFRGNQAVKSYQAAGQAGGEFMAMGQIFLHDPNTLAVFDPLKKSILLFDLDLNYISEKKLSQSYVTQIMKISRDRYIISSFFGEYVFSFLDQNFKEVEGFIKINPKSPSKKLIPQLFNQGIFIDENTVAFTSPLQLTSNCFVDIYDIPTRRKTLVLKWKNSFPIPSQSELNQFKKFHALGNTYKYSGYYWVQNIFYPKKITLNLNNIEWELEELIFNDKGQFLFQQLKFPYTVIPSNDKKRVFAKDEDCNILVADISDIRKKLSNSNK